MRSTSLLVLAVAACGGSPPTPSTLASATPTSTGHEAAEIHAAPPPDDVERYRVPLGGAPVRGEGRLVTIVQFSDFECPFCARVVPTIERLLERYPAELRVVFRHFPLPFHRHAEPAAAAAIEVRRQLGDEAFWKFHDRLFAQPQDLSPETLVRHAADLGADPQAVRAAIASGAHRRAIDEDRIDGVRVGVQGTPAQFINGRPLMGAQPYEAFAQVVEEEIALARARGVDPQSDWYETLLADAPTSAAPEHARESEPDTTVYHVPVEGAPTRGPDHARITLVAFTDFQCPFCGRAVATLDELRERLGDDLRVVVRHFPLPFHTHAMGAHEAAQEAYAQGGDEAFFAMHDRLFANQRALTEADLEGYAAELGLDVDRFRRAMRDHRHQARVEADMELGRRLGVQGTPTFFLNGRRLLGAQPIERFLILADEVRAEAQAALDAGTAPEALYATLIADGVREVDAVPRRPAPTAPTVPDELPSEPPVPEHAPRRGSADAAVTIQVFSDFECPFCARINPRLERALRDYDGQVRVVFRHLPLPMHRHAQLAAEAAVEVRAQGGDEAFWRFHDRLFANQSALTRADLERYAAELPGIDVQRLRQALDDHRHASVIDADRRAARAVGASGTPTLVLGRHVLQGARPYVEIEEVLDELLAD